jgi:hypothetical protein
MNIFEFWAWKSSHITKLEWDYRRISSTHHSLTENIDAMLYRVLVFPEEKKEKKRKSSRMAHTDMITQSF